MMDESKLTNFQRRQLQENMKSKSYLPDDIVISVLYAL